MTNVLVRIINGNLISKENLCHTDFRIRIEPFRTNKQAYGIRQFQVINREE